MVERSDSQKNGKHDMTLIQQYPREHEAWKNMRGRCSRDRYYQTVKVCAEWQFSFEQFLEDVGARPDGCVALVRLNKSRDYEPGNVCWGTASDRNSGRRIGKTTPVLAR